MNQTITGAKVTPLVRVLKQGFVYNPLISLPRNMPCPCHSGKKFKNCCLEITPAAVKTEHLPNYVGTYEKALTGEKSW